MWIEPGPRCGATGVLPMLAALAILTLLPGVAWAQSADTMYPAAAPYLVATIAATPEDQRNTSMRQALVQRSDGHIEVVHDTLAGLTALAADPDVRRVELARPLRASLEAAQDAQGVGMRRGELPTGSGAIVAVIDSGVDFDHPAFVDPDGETRIAWILDMSLDTRAEHADIETFGGAAWSRAEIQDALDGGAPVAHLDVNGHGTHIASIAAGGSGASLQGEAGMAPGAELIVVRANRQDVLAFSDGDVLNSLRFVDARAAEMRLPWVANLSLGIPGGPGDGSTLFEKAIDDIVADAPGKVVVVAAGNTGLGDIKADAEVSGDARVQVRVPEVAREGGEDRAIRIDIWYEGELTAGFEGAGAALAAVTPGEAGRHDRGSLGIWTSAHEYDAAAERGHISIRLSENGAGLDPGDFAIVLQGNAHAELTLSDLISGEAAFLDHVEMDERLVIPATAQQVLVVGSWSTRNEWPNDNGSVDGVSTDLGEVSLFSAPGPTSDGRPLPDLVAPGDAVVAAMSADADPLSSTHSVFLPLPYDAVGPERRHAALRGTSVAAPFVTGTVALMLSQARVLTTGDVRAILRATTRIDAETGNAVYAPRWGFGKLNPLAAVDFAQALEASQSVSSGSSSAGLPRDVVKPGEPFQLWVVPRDSDGLPAGEMHNVTVMLGDEVLESVAIQRRWPGVIGLRVVAPDRIVSREKLTVLVGGIALEAAPTLNVAESRAEAGTERPDAVEFGCSVMPATSPSDSLPPVLLLLFGTFWVRLRRRRHAGFLALMLAVALVGCQSESTPSPEEKAEAPPEPTAEEKAHGTALDAATDVVHTAAFREKLRAVDVYGASLAAYARKDAAVADAAWTLLEADQLDTEGFERDADFWLARGEGLLDLGRAADARALMMREELTTQDARFIPLIDRSFDEDPAFIPPMRTLTPDVDLDAIKYLGGGSTVVLRFIKEKQTIAAFKPKQTRMQSDYRAEIAAWRVCPMIRCGFDIPYNEPVRLAWRDFHGLYARLSSPKQIAYKDNLKDVVPIKEDDGDWVVGTMKAWVPGFVNYPIEITQIWRPWLSLEYEEDVLDGKAADSLKPIEQLHPSGAKLRNALTVQMGALTRRDFARQVSNMLVFDFLTNNWDRFSGVKEFWGVNCQFKDGRFVSIDNGASFPRTPNEKVEKQLFRVQRFSRTLVRAVRAMDHDATLVRLFPDPTEYERARFETFWEQRNRLLEHIDGLIAEHGEDKILVFD